MSPVYSINTPLQRESDSSNFSTGVGVVRNSVAAVCVTTMVYCCCCGEQRDGAFFGLVRWRLETRLVWMTCVVLLLSCMGRRDGSVLSLLLVYDDAIGSLAILFWWYRFAVLRWFASALWVIGSCDGNLESFCCRSIGCCLLYFDSSNGAVLVVEGRCDGSLL